MRRRCAPLWSAPHLPEDGRQEVHATFAGSRLELIENAGHFPWLEQPEKVYGALTGFLASDCH